MSVVARDPGRAGSAGVERGRGRRAGSDVPNLIAFAALFLWPLVTAALFRRLPPGRALIAALLAGYLLLPPAPAGIDLPVLPPFDKDTIPALSALVMVLILHRPGLTLLPQGRAVRLLIGVYLAAPVATVLANGDPVFWGPRVLPGLQLREALGAVMQQAITLSPFLLARHFLSRTEDQRDLLMALMIGGLVYSVPMLVEMRLSPQVNIWVYGYFQHSFAQMMRGDGYRPIVFLYHGLWVAFYAMTAAVAAGALVRGTKGRAKVTLAAAALYLALLLVLCKSLGALAMGAAVVPLLFLAGRRTQVLVAAALAVAALCYPAAKLGGLLPEDRILAAIARFSAERAFSLEFRLGMESLLIDRAMERPLFGWGLWGRNLIYDVTDGRMLVIPDGRWVLTIGVLGITGFIAEFGLLTLPLLLLARQVQRGRDPGPWTGAVALIVAVNLVDMVPNATLTPLTWLFAGAALGFAERRSRDVVAPRAPLFRTVI